MKAHLQFKDLCIILLMIIGGMFINSCSQENPVMEKFSLNNTQIQTRAESSWHWRCPKCGFLNAGWQFECTECHSAYSPLHGDLIITFYDIISDAIHYSTTIGGIGNESLDRIIELPTFIIPIPAAKPWYETSNSLTYYEALKTINYYASQEYAEGVEFGWYRTVRILYPKLTNISSLDYAYDKWSVGAGRELRGKNGTGIKDGTKAAIKAFKAYR
ncbi:hypothetical protein [Bacteroides sp.]|uniref:hypothetical protein n=1 Tax=Bacteroides sp. TaxID=29523 RepID=UPI004026452D